MLRCIDKSVVKWRRLGKRMVGWMEKLKIDGWVDK